MTPKAPKVFNHIKVCDHVLKSIIEVDSFKHDAKWFSSWRHQMETFSALLAICAGNSPVSGEFPAQRPVTRSFDIFFELRLNKRLSWWFETPSCPLWRQCNAKGNYLGRENFFQYNVSKTGRMYCVDISFLVRPLLLWFISVMIFYTPL